MRRDPEYFGEEDLELIYIAKKLSEALELEELLSERGLDYLVEPDTFSGGVIFRRARVGAFFYVRPGDGERGRHVLSENGYRPFEPLREDPMPPTG
jgi:hypothetical protein